MSCVLSEIHTDYLNILEKVGNPIGIAFPKENDFENKGEETSKNF